jgi:predicted nucleotidyltransferase
MKTLSEIKSVLHAHADELRGRYGITSLAVFGSVARGEAADGSDVDILAEVERPIGLIALVGAENYLTELVGMKVDLVLKRSVRSELRERIIGEAVAV